MAETNINVSRENIAQAVENVTKLSREEIQKWRDFVNAELQKTELDEKTREKYQNYKNALEKAMQVGNAQMASLQNEVVLKPVQSTDIADSEKAASEVKSENEDPKVKADSHVKATQTETPKTEKKPTIDPLKTKEELSEYQNDVAGYLKSILINNGELNAQSIKKALEMVHDFSALKYTSTTLDGFGLDMEEKDVLKHTPQAVRAVVGSVFVSSLFANGYTMKISGQEVHVFQRNGVSDVTLGDANALSTQMTAFIKGNPGFLEVLKAGLLFQSGDLEKYHQLHSSTDGKLYEPEKHSYQSFVNHLNKQDDKTLAATAIAESNMTMEKKEFDGYLAMAGVMPAQTTDLLKTMAKNPSVVKELQVMSESRSSHSGGLFGPVALSTTFTRDERAHSLQMYDGERPAEMNERFKKNPLGTAIDMVLNDGLLRGGSRAMEGLDNTPVMIKWGIILWTLTAVLFSKKRWWIMGGLGALFIANGWWEKYNLLENARDKYNNGPRIDQNSIKEAKEAMKQYVTEQEKQDNATKVHQDELLKVNPALANDPEKLAEATKESVEFSNHFKDENVSVIKSYVDHKKWEFKNAENKARMDDPNNATNVKVLRGEIATMDKEFEEFLVQLRIRNDKDPSREFSPEEVDKVRSAMRIEFNDMTLDERRTFFAMSPDDRDKWVHERVRGEEDNTTNPVTVAAAGVAGAATAYGLYHVALALFGWAGLSMLIPRLKDRFSKTKTPKTPGTPGTPSDPSNPDDGKVKSSKVNVRKVPERALWMSDADRKAQLEEFMSQADQRANSTIKKVGGAILAHTPYLKNGHNKRATERSDARAQAMNEWDALDNKELIQQQFQEQVTNSEAEIEKAKNEKKGLEKDKKRLEALKAKENDATEKQKIEDQIKDINDKIDKQQEIIDKKAGIAAGKIDYKIGAVTLRLDLNEYIEIKKLMDDMEKIAQSGDPLLRSKLGGGFSDTLSAKGVVYMHKYEELYSKISVSGGATLMADPTVTWFMSHVIDMNTGKAKFNSFF